MKIVTAVIVACALIYAMTFFETHEPTGTERQAGWDDAMRAVAAQNVTARNAAQRADGKYRECLGRKKRWNGTDARCEG